METVDKAWKEHLSKRHCMPGTSAETLGLEKSVFYTAYLAALQESVRVIVDNMSDNGKLDHDTAITELATLTTEVKDYFNNK